MSNAIGSSRESNPSRRICNLRAVPLGHVADIFANRPAASEKVSLRRRELFFNDDVLVALEFINDDLTVGRP